LNKSYDIVVIGAGLSSLMFLSRYIINNKDQSILLIEKDANKNINQTFCVWQGPGLIDIKNTYNLKPKHVWSKVEVSNEGLNIQRDISPYSYECFDGKETLSKLLSQCKKNITYRKGFDVKKIKNNKNLIEVVTNEETIHTKFIVDSRNKISKKQYDSPPNLKQVFVGNEILSSKDQFNPEIIKLMSFKKNRKDVEFTYTLPFSRRHALIETTLFSKSSSFVSIKKIHNESLSKYKKFKSVKEEKGIIPMILDRDIIIKNNIPIGLSAGMARPSTGYSMMRIALWVNSVEKKKIKNTNISEFQFRPNKLLEWLDSIFLTACYFWPNKAPIIFMKLFDNADIKSIIRFMSDAPNLSDIFFIVLGMPKKLMIRSFIKKYVE